MTSAEALKILRDHYAQMIPPAQVWPKYKVMERSYHRSVCKYVMQRLIDTDLDPMLIVQKTHEMLLNGDDRNPTKYGRYMLEEIEDIKWMLIDESERRNSNERN